MTINENDNPKYPLSSIYFYLTEGCNLRCRHCWIAPKYQGPHKTYPSLDIELFHSIIDQAKPLGLRSLKLTGGEPLLHPDISEMLERVHSEGFSLAIETNGTLCTPELVEEIVASSEKIYISVSLDGVDAETHEWVRGVKGCFEATLKGIENLVSAGLKLQIIMSIMKRNVHQMESVVRLAESMGAGSVKFNIIQPIARGINMYESMETLDIEQLVEIGKWVENELETSLSIIYSHPVAFTPLGKILARQKLYGYGCITCAVRNIIGVLSDGSYALCGIGVTEPELIFGHAAKDRLREVWDNSAVLNEIREGLPERLEGVCSDCVLKSKCLGHCLAMNYGISKSLWAPFWYCDMARKAGLFPESRLRSSLAGSLVS